MIIGFWNINGKDLSDYLIDFVKDQQIDILVLAEATEKTILNFLKKSKKMISVRVFTQLSGRNTKVTILTSYNQTLFTNWSSLYTSPRWLAYTIEIPSIIKFNLFCIHFHSKVNWAKESLALECVNLSRDIAIVEKQTGVTETILIGDFNMNPFEDGMVAAIGLNAIQDLNYATKRPNGRKIDGTEYRYFYNPMWRFMGDKEKPYGTHYCRPAGHISQEWNTYDQVLFRASMKTYLDKDYLQIIDRIGTEKLTKAFNRPDKKNYSDHLPIIFKLK